MWKAGYIRTLTIIRHAGGIDIKAGKDLRRRSIEAEHDLNRSVWVLS